MEAEAAGLDLIQPTVRDQHVIRIIFNVEHAQSGNRRLVKSPVNPKGFDITSDVSNFCSIFVGGSP